MTTSQSNAHPAAHEAQESLRRRGLLAAAVGLVIGFVAKFTEQPVSAGVDGDVVLGVDNTTPSPTSITCTGHNSYALNLNGHPADGGGLAATGGFVGVSGSALTSGNSRGVEGSANGTDSFGVVGGNNPGTGVWGASLSGNGVLGSSSSGLPILGKVADGSSSNTIAIYGRNYSTYAGPTPGAGGFGVYGISAKGHGLVGATAAAGAAAVVGASNGVPGAYAGAFYGSVVVSGAFTVVGGPKSAGVPHPDGSLRRLYCVESPESWFEDFGEAQLSAGHAEIVLDPDFAAMVHLDRYQVFLTEYDRQSDLCVTARSAGGFCVQSRDGQADARFGWRVVAKRKDIKGARLEPLTVPPEPRLPDN